MARSSECTEQYAQKVLDNADIVRDAILRQQALAKHVFAVLERGARRSGDVRLPLPRVPLDPILGQMLGLNDLCSCHMPSDLSHIIVRWGSTEEPTIANHMYACTLCFSRPSRYM
jgi:hypothetical protein